MSDPKHGEWWWVSVEGHETPWKYEGGKYIVWSRGDYDIGDDEPHEVIARCLKPEEVAELRRQAYWQGVNDERSGGSGEGEP